MRVNAPRRLPLAGGRVAAWGDPRHHQPSSTETTSTACSHLSATAKPSTSCPPLSPRPTFRPNSPRTLQIRACPPPAADPRASRAPCSRIFPARFAGAPSVAGADALRPPPGSLTRQTWYTWRTAAQRRFAEDFKIADNARFLSITRPGRRRRWGAMLPGGEITHTLAQTLAENFAMSREIDALEAQAIQRSPSAGHQSIKSSCVGMKAVRTSSSR